MDMDLDRNKALKFGLIVVVFAAVLYFLFPFYPISDVIDLGLDLRGGTRIVLKAKNLEGKTDEEKAEIIDKVVTILKNRVNQYGLTEPNISSMGNERVLIELPGTSDREEAQRFVGRTALLEFQKVLKSAGPGDTLNPSGTGEEVLKGRENEEGETRKYLVREEPMMTGKVLSDAQVRTSQSSRNPIIVSLQFTDEGARKFARVVQQLEPDKDRLAIVLDGVVQSAPVIKQSLRDQAESSNKLEGAVIEGQFSSDEAQRLAIVLRAGRLPTEVEPLHTQVVGPSLGGNAIRTGVLSIIIGFILILIFMIARYKWLGIVADSVLVFNMLIMFGVLAAAGATLTLPGIAGVILTIGISIDANIIIFERIKEERIAGKSISSAIREGFSKSLSTVLDANLTTLATAIILMYFGSGPVRGFAITLTIGILGSMFCALFVTRFILNNTWLGEKIPAKAES